MYSTVRILSITPQLRGAKRKMDVGNGSAFDFDLNAKKAPAVEGKTAGEKSTGAAESR